MNRNIPFVKLGGFSAIIGGILLALGHLLNGFLNNGENTLVGQTFIFTAHLLLIFSFIGIYNKHSSTLGNLGGIGTVLGIIGSIAVCSIVFVEISETSNVDTSQIINAPVVNIIHSFGPLLFVLGLILFSIAVLRIKNNTKWAGALLLIGNFIFIAGSFSAGINLFTSIFGSLFTASGFIWLGSSLIISSYQISE